MGHAVVTGQAATLGCPPGSWLVVGGSGQVGGALLEHLGPSARWSARQPSAPFRLDLAELSTTPSPAARLLEQLGPRVVVITAGMTNVDACEDDVETARRLNTEGPAVLASLARRVGARTVLLSTDYVFDGLAGPYDESASPRPLSVYGATKLEGERAVLEADPDALVVRTTVVYGPDRAGKNFACRLLERLGRGLLSEVPCDQISSPTYNRDLAACIVRAVDAGWNGVLHVAGPDLMARDDFARSIAKAWGHDPGLVRSVRTDQLRQRAPRPARAGLRSGRHHLELRPVPEALSHWRGEPDLRTPTAKDPDLARR